MVACFVFNALEGAGTIVWATTKGRLVPERLLGVSRASTGSSRSASCPCPSRSPARWPLCSGPGATLVGAGILGAIVTLGFLFLPGMRDIERSGDLARASAEDDELALGFLADDPMVPIGAGGTPRGSEAAEIGS